MPKRRASFSQPAAWLVAGSWPDGEFAEDAPEAVAHAVAIAAALAAALEGYVRAEVAEAADIDRTTIYHILNGTSWADTVTLAKLEAVLGTSLWPASPPTLRRRSSR